MVRPIVIFPDSKLTTRCEQVKSFDFNNVLLIGDLLHTLGASNGIGLAAPQIGVLKRVFVMDTNGDNPDPRAFINPEIIVRQGEAVDEEGCLSMPGIYLPVRRATSITLGWRTTNGEWVVGKFHGLEARCIQHEIDHLDGILFTQRAIAETTATT